MSNLARKHQPHFQTIQKPNTEVIKVKRHARITLGEKILALLLVAFIGIMAVQIISAQTEIYEVNKGIEDVKKEIQDQQKINDNLEMQISDMSKYERIGAKAKELGLNLDEDNVRVVEKK